MRLGPTSHCVVRHLQKPFACCRRSFSHTAPNHDAVKPVDGKSFSSTLILPKTSFPLWTLPSKGEAPFRERTTDALYHWQRTNAKGPVFVLHDGPPYANGDLHMGHALNKIIKDIINRFHLSQGRKIHYVPGWDCHGLPIENKALKELGKDSVGLDATTIRNAARVTAEREIASQREQFRQFGIMADWDEPTGVYRTLDHSYEMRQLRIFRNMVEKGLIYRHYRPVHYSPSSRSALAEAELVYRDDHVSHSVYVSFQLTSSSALEALLGQDSSVHLLVWTTTPWTLTANMGIAVHPDITYSVVRRHEGSPSVVLVAKERLGALAELLGVVEVTADVQGSELIGATYAPIFSSLLEQTASPPIMKIISASHVTTESGTGLVHCAPAHGAEDYAAFRSLGLISSTQEMLCHVDSAGKFNEEVIDVVGPKYGPMLIGQDVMTGGSKAVVDILRELQSLVRIQRFKHRYPYDWKTDQPIIVTATSQWFANLDKVKSDALEALKDVTFFPIASRNRLESFIQSRSEWCISRQRVWGVPIPSLHHIATDRAVLDKSSLDHILSVLDEKGISHWWDGPVEDFVPPALLEAGVPAAETWRKGTDTMDVWFDSGTSWSMLPELHGLGTDRLHHADVCLEGSDQHRGWFQSQLLTAVGSTPAGTKAHSPYQTLMTHGMVLDDKGKKMSKSLGNIMSPMTVIHGGKNTKKEPAYGADILRLWAASVEYWRDMSIGPTALAQTAETMRKIRNSARFMLGNIGDADTRTKHERVPHQDLVLAELYVMNELYKLERLALDGYASYNFPKVVTALNHFSIVTLSSLYLDFTKDSLYADSIDSLQRKSIITVLEKIATSMTYVMAPILPHLAEEIHVTMHATAETPANSMASVFTKPWNLLDPVWKNEVAEREMNELLRVRVAVLALLEKARGEKLIKSSLEAEVDIVIPGDIPDGVELVTLLRREENFLKTLFIVSDSAVLDEGSLGTTSPDWLFIDSVSIPGCDEDLGIRVRPAVLQKCPRCWTFTKAPEQTICTRCTAVVDL